MICKLAHRLALAVALLTATTQVHAADTDSVPTRPVLAMWEAGVGSEHLLDTYLTPITYVGPMVSLGFEHTQATGFAPQRAMRQLALSVGYGHVKNPVRNNTMHHLALHAQWSLTRRWQQAFHPQLELQAGGAAWVHGGVIYNSQNSNNVVSVKAQAAVALCARAAFATRLGRYPTIVHLQATLPVLGAFFSPDYDESYYEMYLGNRKHLAHLSWWGNRFDMSTRLATDIHFGGTILRLGYRLGVERSWVRQLNTHITTHEFIIGIGGEFITVKRHH